MQSGSDTICHTLESKWPVVHEGSARAASALPHGGTSRRTGLVRRFDGVEAIGSSTRTIHMYHVGTVRSTSCTARHGPMTGGSTAEVDRWRREGGHWSTLGLTSGYTGRTARIERPTRIERLIGGTKGSQ